MVRLPSSQRSLFCYWHQSFIHRFRQLGAAFHTGMAGKTSILKYEDFMNREPSLPVGGTQD